MLPFYFSMCDLKNIIYRDILCVVCPIVYSSMDTMTMYGHREENFRSPSIVLFFYNEVYANWFRWDSNPWTQVLATDTLTTTPRRGIVSLSSLNWNRECKTLWHFINFIHMLVYLCRHKWRLFKNKLTTLINNTTKAIWKEVSYWNKISLKIV